MLEKSKPSLQKSTQKTHVDHAEYKDLNKIEKVPDLSFSCFRNHTNKKVERQLTFLDLCSMAKNPGITKNKSDAACFASNDCDRKTREVVEAHNAQTLLIVDIDQGNKSIDQIKEGLSELSINHWLIYSTFSSTLSNCKWRVVISLPKPITIDVWRLAQEVLCDCLGGDVAALKPTQLAYVPCGSMEGYSYEYK